MANKFGYVYKKSRLKLTSLNIVYNIGSAFEKPGMRGISHLMEHLITKAVDKYEDRFLNDCIEFNAYTSLNHVVVYFRGLDSKLTPDFKQELVNAILYNFNEITQEQFDTEKMIVTQEILDEYENPDDGHFANILYGYYNVTDPAGVPEDVANFTLKEARKLAKDFFSKPARIVEVGPTSTTFKKIKYNTEIAPTNVPKFKKTKNIIKNVAAGDKVCMFGLSKKILKKSDYPYLIIGLNMLSDGLQSPLYQEISEKRGLSYFVGADKTMFGQAGIVDVFVCTTPEKLDELISVFTKIKNNIKKYLTKDRFKIIINLIKTKREIEKCLPYKGVSDLITPEDLRLPKNLDKIEFKKVVEVTEKYFGENMVIETR